MAWIVSAVGDVGCIIDFEKGIPYTPLETNVWVFITGVVVGGVIPAYWEQRLISRHRTGATSPRTT